jgi:hypothetical protein
MEPADTATLHGGEMRATDEITIETQGKRQTRHIEIAQFTTAAIGPYMSIYTHVCIGTTIQPLQT